MLSCMVRTEFGPKSWTIALKKINSGAMAKQLNVRWAFKAAEWTPTDEQILAASTYIQNEEKDRIEKFVFQTDAKTSLIGRLMLRKFVHEATSIPYSKMRLGRDNNGKPILMDSQNKLFFNVSHQGDLVVLAGSTEINVGIDVMKVEAPCNKDIPEFFRLMKRQFSADEWETIRSFPTEAEQIACFYRNWCLKESYVKNTGTGITVNLQDLSFNIKTRKLKVGEMVNDTELYKRRVLMKNWVFEETLLDEKHAVAVAMELEDTAKWMPTPYKFLTFEELVAGAEPLHAADTSWKFCFMNKIENKPSLMDS